MKIDLSDIVRVSGSFAEMPFEIEMANVEETPLTALITGKLYITSSSHVLMINGYLDTKAEMTCARCGEAAFVDVHADISEDFEVEPPQHHTGGPKVIEDDVEESCLFYPGTTDLNLEELLRQNILPALPIRALCTEDCPGLCTHCGTKLTNKSCPCQDEVIKPEWAELKKIFENKKTGDGN
jgi:uncharacterized protein